MKILEIQMPHSIKAAALAAVLISACGTRVGNPQQPQGSEGSGGGNKPIPGKEKDKPSEKPSENPVPTLNLLTLPVVNFQLPSSIVQTISGSISIPDPNASPLPTATSMNLTAQKPLKQVIEEGITAGINNIPRSIAQVVTSINSLSSAVNQVQVAKVGDFFSQVDGRPFSGTIKNNASPDAIGEYEGLFCIDQQPFAHYKWKGDGSYVEVRRQLKLDPFVQTSDADHGLDLKRYVKFVDGELKQFTLKKDGAITANDQNFVSEILHADATLDKDGKVEYRSIASRRRVADPISATIVPDAYSTGRYREDGSGRVLYHDSTMRLIIPICQTVVDSANASQPGWCFQFDFGPKISNIQTKYSARDMAKLPTGDLSGIGVSKPSELSTISVMGEHSTIPGCPQQQVSTESISPSPSMSPVP